MSKNKKVSSGNAAGMIRESLAVGDNLVEQYYDKKDFQAVNAGLKAYSTALGVAKAQVMYKRLSNSPVRIPFFED